MAEDLKDGEYKSFSLRSWFNDHPDQFIDDINDQIGEALSNWRELDDPTVSFIEEPESITVEEVAAIDENNLYLTIEVLAEVSIEAFIYKWDYDSSDDTYPIVMVDTDWNESYVFVSMSMALPIKLSAVFNIDSEKIESYEIDTIEIWGWCRFCGATILSDSAEGCRKCGKEF